jgi:hypothetical protein
MIHIVAAAMVAIAKVVGRNTRVIISLPSVLLLVVSRETPQASRQMIE